MWSIWTCLESQTQNHQSNIRTQKKYSQLDAERTYREISLLNKLNHPNIIKLIKVIKAKNNLDLYLIFDHM